MNSRVKDLTFSAPRQPRGEKLFSFAVVADTHVNESEHTCASPFATNARANARARHVFRDIAALQPAPDFVIHLGDIVHPVPGLPTFDEAARRFKDMARVLPMPLHVVPGNHDVGDKRVDWMPADVVCEAYVEKYRSTFGDDYYAVDHRGAKFLFLNALLFNSGLPAEQAQMDWIDRALDEAANRRVFVCLHYPPFLHDRAEKGSYDNIDEPGRSWLIERLERPNVEAVFAGHVHNFWYEVLGRAEFYMLPSTAFLRHDFSEFYRVAPADEYGRGDVAKFGYFVVDVYEHGHVAQLVRTYGAAVDENAPAAAAPAPRRLTHAKTAGAPGLAVELRHPWAEVVEIPCTGGVQEFGRKPARNDYPLMAMWEMGVRTLKIPLQDLAGEQTLRRARMMSEVGHAFVVTCLGCPDPGLIEQAERGGVRLLAVELNLGQRRLGEQASRIQALRQATGAELVYAKIRSAEDDSHYDGRHYSHFVNTGMRLSELDGADWLREALDRRLVDGYAVRLDWGDDLLQAHAALARHARAAGCAVWGCIKLASHLAQANDDDHAIATLAAQAYLASRSGEAVRYAFDTFMDVDRGYFPRNGFIDRRYDPRPAGRVLAALNALLPDGMPVSIRSDSRGIDGLAAASVEAGGRRYRLLSGPRSAAEADLAGIGAGRNYMDLAADGAEGGEASRKGSGRVLWLAALD